MLGLKLNHVSKRGYWGVTYRILRCILQRTVGRICHYCYPKLNGFLQEYQLLWYQEELLLVHYVFNVNEQRLVWHNSTQWMPQMIVRERGLRICFVIILEAQAAFQFRSTIKMCLARQGFVRLHILFIVCIMAMCPGIGTPISTIYF